MYIKVHLDTKKKNYEFGSANPRSSGLKTHQRITQNSYRRNFEMIQQQQQQQ
ncbi:MAG: hypothetical protein VXW04_02025 [Bacteroidota bacterium]|nr:hypothetical protein [Bacteroidota bacterium]